MYHVETERSNHPRITSRDNPLIRKLTALTDARSIRKYGVCLVGGARLVREAWENYPELVAAVVAVTPAQAPLPGRADVPCHLLSPALFKAVNVLGAPAPLLLMRLPALPLFDPDAAWPDGCTLFVPFGDPENVGGAIRSAAALGAARVVLTAEAASPFLPRALRASACAVWRVPLLQAGFLAELTWPQQCRIFTLDAGGRPLDQVARPAGTWGLVAGREGPGLPERLRGHTDCVAIPMQRGVESLNAATAAGIAMWHWRAPVP